MVGVASDLGVVSEGEVGVVTEPAVGVALENIASLAIYKNRTLINTTDALFPRGSVKIT